MGGFDTTGAMAFHGFCPKEFKIGDKIRAKYVGQFEGQRVFESDLLGSFSRGGEYSAFTLPDIGIFAADGVFTSSQIDGIVMMQHEFGHVLQYRKVGKDFYYRVIAKESAMNCNDIWPYDGIPHAEYWTETWANYLSKQYFGERWLGMETQILGRESFFYPSKNVNLPFLIKKSLLPF
ncbi:FKBP-type peptidyl-prolyl cis-trans isomerase [Prevotella sp. E2-28]|uniref:FKBP-type peptidyl-prolyl cis-trans isomerase n=1 Tax=Prevotella sp. E2-28 TaxID=2913620 RepID=UPI001EDAE584|nr:FKBP-type peptidyl-prolyl cis-trans isomerase [Prevotella sp. E2-28]UKK53729.1 FKBP-type peptidyl-prolyl cis-trans isomerase [Prevotella sp. E2-28]